MMYTSTTQYNGQDIEAILKRQFGHNQFRTGQKEVIENILKGVHTVAVFPTGGGKSLCYQIPALILPGTTLVVSPLISLMKDQVDALVDKQIPATYISSTLSDREVFMRIKRLGEQGYKIIYIAPERFNSDSFLTALKKIHIPLIVVDEAHCISQWGHNFRPAYLKIRELITCAGSPTIAAFTATANKKVQQDIIDLLGMDRCRLFIGSFDRPNLELKLESPKDSKAYIRDYISKHPDDSGIVYAATRKKAEEIFYYLMQCGLAAGLYHAGLSNDQRNDYQDHFICGKIRVMVATNAFGMGINKSNVRYIIHYNMPKSLENYYQEAGRAGRDGEKACCILLKTPGDYDLNKFLISSNYPSVKTIELLLKKIHKCGVKGYPLETLLYNNTMDNSNQHSVLNKLIVLKAVERRGSMVYATSDLPLHLSQKVINNHMDIEIEKLNNMKGYCEGEKCLRAYILQYFNEQPTRDRCDYCSVCLTSKKNHCLFNKLLSNIRRF